jgi:hypothetical protein
MVAANFDTDAEESEDQDDGEIEEIISDIEDECANVFDNEANANTLNQIFDMARTNYEKERKAWKSFMADLKFELIATDDEDNIKDILGHFFRKATLELN